MQNIIAILGMHRSGTSMLTGSLQEAGLYLGNVYAKNKYNQKGNRESPILMSFHERLLEQNGGTWQSPPNFVRWSDEDKDKMKAFIKNYDRKPNWGFKDPRTLFVIEGWQELIPNLKLVGIFRNPMAVALSLQHRDQFTIEKGLDIWMKYNERLLELYQKSNFPIIEFINNTILLQRSIKTLVSILELKQRDISTFFSKELVHNESSITELPEEVLILYKKLQTISVK